MRIAVAIAALAGSYSLARADTPATEQLPKKCVAESPVDSPCATFQGTYRFTVQPAGHDDKCFIKKPIETEITIGKPLKYGYVQLRAPTLVTKLHWKQRKADELRASADVRDGVCCIDVRVTQTTGMKDHETEHRLIVHLAAGRTVVNGSAQERIMPERGDDCQNDLAVTATRVK